MKDLRAAELAVRIVRFYQRWLSPLKGPRCRFYPSCSEYCAQAIRQRGVLRGLGLGALRVARCHPFNPGGYDPVPPHRGKLRTGGVDTGEGGFDERETGR